MSWIAEYDTQGREFPTCVHVTKTTGTMTHGVTYVPIEGGKSVRAENAKLRKLVRDMWSAFCFVMEGGIMTRDPGNFLEQRMRELGIEEDE